MKQMNMSGLDVVPIDYQKGNFSGLVKDFRPAVYKDGDSFGSILGPGPEEGVFGRGKTPEEALADWDRHLRARINAPREGNKLDEYIQDTIASSSWVIW